MNLEISKPMLLSAMTGAVERQGNLNFEKAS
jgi:hypothetical protein